MASRGRTRRPPHPPNRRVAPAWRSQRPLPRSQLLLANGGLNCLVLAVVQERSAPREGLARRGALFGRRRRHVGACRAAQGAWHCVDQAPDTVLEGQSSCGECWGPSRSQVPPSTAIRPSADALQTVLGHSPTLQPPIAPAALLAPRPRAMAHALQLTDVAHGEQKEWRRHQHLVDALPYVDGLTPAEKQAVDKLIEEEVRRLGPGRPRSERGARLAAAAAAAAHCRCAATPPPSVLQMRSSSKKPSDYLDELPPLPETRFKVRAVEGQPRGRRCQLPPAAAQPACSYCALTPPRVTTPAAPAGQRAAGA